MSCNYGKKSEGKFLKADNLIRWFALNFLISLAEGFTKIFEVGLRDQFDAFGFLFTNILHAQSKERKTQELFSGYFATTQATFSCKLFFLFKLLFKLLADCELNDSILFKRTFDLRNSPQGELT